MVQVTSKFTTVFKNSNQASKIILTEEY